MVNWESRLLVIVRETCGSESLFFVLNRMRKISNFVFRHFWLVQKIGENGDNSTLSYRLSPLYAVGYFPFPFFQSSVS